MVVLLAFEHAAARKQSVWLGACFAARSGERRCVACGRQAVVRSTFTHHHPLHHPRPSSCCLVLICAAAGGTGVVAQIMALATLSTG